MIARASALKAREIDRFTPANFWILRQYFENAPSINGCSNEEEEEEDDRRRGGSGRKQEIQEQAFFFPLAQTPRETSDFSQV